MNFVKIAVSGSLKAVDGYLFCESVIMPRFYFPVNLIPDVELKLPDGIVRHIHVLRLRVGETIVLFNGDGATYTAKLLQLDKRQALCRILTKQPENQESSLSIKLVQAISSGERMDFTIQKSVELGVVAIQPVMSTRSVVRLSGERAEKRVQRWQEIAISACEQCGRNRIPEILPIMSLSQYLQQKSDELHILMSLRHPRSLKDFSPPSQVTLMIGAEGGWTETEENMAFAANCQALMLGKRVLRTETAALAAIAAMQTLWGDFV